MKKRSKAVVFLVAICLLLSITALSAQTSAAPAGPMSVAAERAAQGGDPCLKAIGVAAGVALGTLSPCSFFCALVAGEATAAIWAFCR